MPFPLALRALAHRSFRRFFIGQTVSAVGYWLQQIAVSWLVYRLTNSSVLLGTLALASNAPMLFLSPFAGLIVDRLDRRKVVLATQCIQMLQAFTLAFLTFTDLIRVEWVIALALVMGLTWVFDVPARQALLLRMVGTKQDLPNAIALNSSIMNLARFIGPAIAGVLLAATGEAWCFLLNGISYLAVLPALWALPSTPGAARVSSWHRQLLEGFSWVWHFLPARVLVLWLCLVSFTAAAYPTLMPIVATQVFGGDARVQGIMVSSAGFGALMGTLMLAARPSIRGLVRVVIASGAAASAGLIVFGWAPSLPIACVALAFVGFGIIVTASGVNTLLQSVVDDDRRGRVISIYVMAFLGVAPVGSFVLGWLARHVGVTMALIGYGCAGVAGALVIMTLYPKIRAQLGRVYRELGIIAPAEPPG